MKKPAARNKQELFLRAYANTGVISSAAKFAKVARSSHYEWLHDPKYAEAFEQAHQQAIEALELELRRPVPRYTAPLGNWIRSAQILRHGGSTVFVCGAGTFQRGEIVNMIQ